MIYLRGNNFLTLFILYLRHTLEYSRSPLNGMNEDKPTLLLPLISP